MVRKQLDWAAVEAKASEMPFKALHYARLDCAKTATAFDHVDRESGTDVAGYYRDEASVYAREMARRAPRSSK